MTCPIFNDDNEKLVERTNERSGHVEETTDDIVRKNERRRNVDTVARDENNIAGTHFVTAYKRRRSRLRVIIN